MSIWLSWILHLVFSNLTVSHSFASSVLLPSTPHPVTWPRFCLLLHSLHKEVQMDAAVLSPVTDKPFSLLDKPVTLEDLLGFVRFVAWLTYMQFTTISNWLNFIPCGKKCTDLWTFTAEFGSKLMSLMMCGLSRFTLQLCLVSHTIRATSPCPFQTVTKTYLHLEVTQMRLVPK